MKKLLSRPYPIKNSTGIWLWKCFVFGLFASLFLFIFKPFGLGGVKQYLNLIIAGYGLVCFVVMAVLNIGITALFPRYFSEQTWTVGRNIFWTIVNVLLISLANAVYSNFIGFFPLNLQYILIFIGYTFAIGIFPIAIFVLIHQAKLEKRFVLQSAEINKAIDHHLDHAETTIGALPIIEIPSQNAGEQFSLKISDLLFIRSSDNYVEIHYLTGQNASKKLIRNSMKEMENCFEHLPQIFRCHKSYLVNLDKVINTSGNAQGLKLHIERTEELVPVSRSLNNLIKEKLTIHP